jgi:hypothetical protein
MKYRHTFQVKAPLAEVAGFHTAATSLKAITPPARSGGPGSARHAGDLPALHPAGLGLGGRLSADQPFPGLGTVPGARPMASGRQHLSQPVGAGRGPGGALHFCHW